MIEHLPILQIILPLLAAPVSVLIPRWRWALLFAQVTLWFTFAISIALLLRVLELGTVIYAIGNWAAPWGIEYRADLLTAFVLLFVSATAALTLTYAPASITEEIPEGKRALFVTLFLLCVAGQLGMVITGDLFNVFVFLEISSLSTYSLIAFGQDRRALLAAFNYLILGTIGGTFILLGIGLIYMHTGSLNMVDIASLLPGLHNVRTVLVGAAFLSVGLALKIALFPLHLWLPNAYTYAPSAVTAFVAATATKVSIYVFLRLAFTVGGRSLRLEGSELDAVLVALSVAGMFAGSLVAIYQNNVKKLLAYSSLAQIGYIILGISFTTVTGLTGGIVHLFNHALTKGALFMAVGAVALRTKGVTLDHMQGIGRRMPWTMAAFVLASLSLIGIPGTAGFISKWYLVAACLERGVWPLAAAVLISSLLSVIYVWRVVEAAYLYPAPPDTVVQEAPFSMLAPIWVLTAAILFFGLNTEWSARLAEGAALVLLRGERP